MNYFKLLLCALLAAPSASFAMQEPIESKTDQQLQLLINAGIAQNQQCIGECHKKAKHVSGDSLRITSCCWQFICAQDAAQITAQQCPFCKKQFSVKQIALSNEIVSLHFLDTNGVELEISNQSDFQALMKCETIQMSRADASGIIDMRNNHPWITTANIQLLAEYIKNPRIICNQSIDRNKDILQLANFMLAPENILHELSNALWEHLQEKETDSKEVKEEKKQLRGIAEPYLHCPAYISLVLQGKLDLILSNDRLDLSYEHLQEVFADNRWLPDEQGNFYNFSHKLVTMRGLDTIISHIHRMIAPGDYLFPFHINLKNNSIGHLDEKFFEYVKNYRCSNKSNNIVIDLQNNRFTSAQKKEIDKKLYKINYTLPEHVNWENIQAKIKYPLYTILPLSCACALRTLVKDAPIYVTASAGLAGAIHGYFMARVYDDLIEKPRNRTFERACGSAGLAPGTLMSIPVLAIIEKIAKIEKVGPLAFFTTCLATTGLSMYLAHKAIPALYNLRDRLTDTISSRLARITHPNIQAKTFSDLERANRVTVKL